jgi:hypothetical protein
MRDPSGSRAIQEVSPPSRRRPTTFRVFPKRGWGGWMTRISDGRSRNAWAFWSALRAEEGIDFEEFAQEAGPGGLAGQGMNRPGFSGGSIS